MVTSAEASPLEPLGGLDGIRRWVDSFYDLVAAHALLKPLFPPDLSESRDKQYAYFVQLFGGPPLYTERWGQPFLRYKHRKARIGQPERDAWMSLAEQALREQTVGEQPVGEDVVAQVVARLAPIADMMINHRPGQQDPIFFNT